MRRGQAVVIIAGVAAFVSFFVVTVLASRAVDAVLPCGWAACG